MAQPIGKVALLWLGDRQARNTATAETSRFQHVFEALKRRNIHAEPAVYRWPAILAGKIWRASVDETDN